MSTDHDHSIISRMVSANGHIINVLIEGEGEPLLLINGLTRPLGSWKPFARALNADQRFEIFCFPRFGGEFFRQRVLRC